MQVDLSSAHTFTKPQASMDRTEHVIMTGMEVGAWKSDGKPVHHSPAHPCKSSSSRAPEQPSEAGK